MHKYVTTKEDFILTRHIQFSSIILTSTTLITCQKTPVMSLMCQRSESDWQQQIDVTDALVDWDAIQEHIQDTLGATSMSWAEETAAGTSNMVRFLETKDHPEDHPQFAVLVPMFDAECPEETVSCIVTAMRYIAEMTDIPVPSIICYNASPAGAGWPYVVMTKANGVALCDVWDDMSDGQRDTILHQVSHIMLEMYSLREDGKPFVPKPHSNGSGTDFWIKLTNDILAEMFPLDATKAKRYAEVWWMQSLIPSLYDNGLDTKGFPLMHNDFHSRNIFIVNTHSDHPQISSIINWDRTVATCTSSFAFPPSFIINPYNGPKEEATQERAKRNSRDREVFFHAVRDAELARYPGSNPVLSQAYRRWEGVYLFERCIFADLHGLHDLHDLFYVPLVEFIMGGPARPGVQGCYLQEVADSSHLKTAAEMLADRVMSANDDDEDSTSDSS